MTSTKRILVTGANKGIGYALLERILAEHPEAFVLLGARDPQRGEAARSALLGGNAQWGDRVEVLPIDVSKDASVRDAAEQLGARFGPQPLFGLVSNAGIGRQGNSFEAVLSVNAWGPWRVGEAFVPLIEDGGRFVIVSSASGPSYLSECSSEIQRVFTDPALTWPELDALLRRTLSLHGPEAFGAQGLVHGDAYGLSKAAANAYMLILAREQPRLRVNACTPGFIATDMTRPYATAQGKSPGEMGMKTPFEGAETPLHLLFETEQSGWYFGSDAERSPLDRYRAPGDPPYRGDE